MQQHVLQRTDLPKILRLLVANLGRKPLRQFDTGRRRPIASFPALSVSTWLADARVSTYWLGRSLRIVDTGQGQ
jgi:hypothetical protein